MLNHTLFFTLLGGVEEESEGGILFRNDFVIFDEAHQMEHVASRHIGLSVSSGQVRYALHRLWNPRTEKGLLATLRKGAAVKLVAELLKEADGFFAKVGSGVRGAPAARPRSAVLAAAKRPWRGGASGPNCASAGRSWSRTTSRLPIQRLREAVSELIKLSEDKEIGQELMECNRRLARIARGSRRLPQPERRGLCLLGRADRPGAQDPGPQRRAG